MSEYDTWASVYDAWAPGMPGDVAHYVSLAHDPDHWLPCLADYCDRDAPGPDCELDNRPVRLDDESLEVVYVTREP